MGRSPPAGALPACSVKLLLPVFPLGDREACVWQLRKVKVFQVIQERTCRVGSRDQPGAEAKVKLVAKGSSNHLRDQTRARCREAWGLRALAWKFHEDSLLFCRSPFEDLFLCLPMLPAPPVPTWLRVKVAWIQEELAANRCPEDCDRRPIRNSFSMSPR